MEDNPSVRVKKERSLSAASYLSPISTKPVISDEDGYYELPVTRPGHKDDNHVYTELGEDRNYYSTPLMDYGSSSSRPALERTDTLPSSYYEIIPSVSDGVYYNTTK